MCSARRITCDLLTLTHPSVTDGINRPAAAAVAAAAVLAYIWGFAISHRNGAGVSLCPRGVDRIPAADCRPSSDTVPFCATRAASPTSLAAAAAAAANAAGHLVSGPLFRPQLVSLWSVPWRALLLRVGCLLPTRSIDLGLLFLHLQSVLSIHRRCVSQRQCSTTSPLTIIRSVAFHRRQGPNLSRADCRH